MVCAPFDSQWAFKVSIRCRVGTEVLRGQAHHSLSFPSHPQQVQGTLRVTGRPPYLCLACFTAPKLLGKILLSSCHTPGPKSPPAQSARIVGTGTPTSTLGESSRSSGHNWHITLALPYLLLSLRYEVKATAILTFVPSAPEIVRRGMAWLRSADGRLVTHTRTLRHYRKSHAKQTDHYPGLLRVGGPQLTLSARQSSSCVFASIACIWALLYGPASRGKSMIPVS